MTVPRAASPDTERDRVRGLRTAQPARLALHVGWMGRRRSEIQRGARTIVLGFGLLLVLYVLAAPLAHYAAIVASGLLLAVAIGSPAAWIAHKTRLPHRAAVAALLGVLLGLLAAFLAWSGPQVVSQLAELDEAVGSGISRAREWLASSGFGRRVLDRLGEPEDIAGAQIAEAPSAVLDSMQRGIVQTFSILTDIAIVLLVGLFVAFAPRQYFEGLLRLVPPERRARWSEVAQTAHETLRRWLRARLILMAVIGVGFGLGLALLGVSLALPLGVLAGLLAFIPYVGPVLTLIPALAVAFVDGPRLALEVFALYTALQLLESNLLDPLVEGHAVHVPPALVLLAQVVAAVWFGPIGVLIATPLLVVVVVAVRMLYVEGRLGEGPAREDRPDATREPPDERTAPARRAPV